MSSASAPGRTEFLDLTTDPSESAQYQDFGGEDGPCKDDIYHMYLYTVVILYISFCVRITAYPDKGMLGRESWRPVKVEIDEKKTIIMLGNVYWWRELEPE